MVRGLAPETGSCSAKLMTFRDDPRHRTLSDFRKARMRTLLFLFIGLVLFVAVWAAKRRAARGPVDQAARPEGDDPSLGEQLCEAAHTFSAAADSLSPERAMLKTALTDLAAQCRALAVRDAEGDGLPATARLGLVRLLLALYGVAERVTALAQRGAGRETDAVLDSSVAVIVDATDALHRVADRADESTLRHLEVDLDVLRERLDAMR